VENDVNFFLGQRSELADRLIGLRNRLASLQIEQELLIAARELFQKVSMLVRYKISERFAELATEALKFIFQRDDLKFIVNLGVKGNLPVAAFSVRVDGHEVDPKEALGGSVYEIIGVCLRLICLEVFKLQGPLILDEPLRSVDEVNLRRSLEFILQYCRSTERQLFIVTHNNQIASSADKLFEVVQEGGVSSVRERASDSI
jgi:DNA repair exonuclease SbcCD ATPase subunit